jgi:thiamine-phosphate pyrophosphorylase
MRSPLLCYITDRTQFSGEEPARRERLLEKIGEAAEAGVDCIQLREKDLTTQELEDLAHKAVDIIQKAQLRTESRELRTEFLINSRTDVALAVSADGVHLPASDLSITEVREIWQQSCLCSAGAPARGTISVSCHQPCEVQQAAIAGADLALFAPVFEKRAIPGTRAAGIDALRQSCQYKIPVLALGGVTLTNASSCLEAGAAGIAAIRLFQENNIADVVRQLRGH